jgi:hypothetical protein
MVFINTELNKQLHKPTLYEYISRIPKVRISISGL